MKEKLGDKVEKFQKNIGQPFKNFYLKEICGQVTVYTTEGVRSASVSFVSFFSGLLLVAELVKYFTASLRQYPMISRLDFLQFNLFIPSLFNLSQRAKNPHCLLNCRSGFMQEIFAKKWNIKLIRSNNTEQFTKNEDG